MRQDLIETVDKLQKFYKKHQRPPTYEEISSLLGFASKNASYKLIRKLISLGVLEKDKNGKIIPKNLFSIQTSSEAQKTTTLITTDYLKKTAEDLLDATHTLAEAHPVPKEEDEFLRVIEATFRRNTFTLLAIVYLSNNSTLADSALDLTRKMIEDTISIEYMIAKGKKESSEKFRRFLWVQLHQNSEFLKTTGANFKSLGLDEQLPTIEREYERVKLEFTHRTGKDLRSWAGKDIETMLEELKQENVLSEFDVSRTAIGYVKGSWKNHFNPYDVHSYLTNDLLEASTKEALNQALVFGTTCLYRLTTRYIDHIRQVTQENQYEDIAQKIKPIWARLNPNNNND